MSHHDELIIEWKRKYIGLEDHAHMLEGKCKKLEIRVHEFEEEELRDADNDSKREGKMRKMKHHFKELEEKYHHLKEEHSHCHEMSEELHHL